MTNTDPIWLACISVQQLTYLNAIIIPSCSTGIYHTVDVKLIGKKEKKKRVKTTGYAVLANIFCLFTLWQQKWKYSQNLHLKFLRLLIATSNIASVLSLRPLSCCRFKMKVYLLHAIKHRIIIHLCKVHTVFQSRYMFIFLIVGLLQFSDFRLKWR